MQTKFKRGQKVKFLVDPDPEYIEYHEEVSDTDSENLPPIQKGTIGEINILLPNGRYHVEIHDAEGNAVAYVPMSEEDLESLE